MSDYNKVEYHKRIEQGLQQWRSRILNRDSYRCKCCGSNYNLECAHITDVTDFVDMYGYNGIEWSFRWDNLITLCHKCHICYHRSKRGFSYSMSDEHYQQVREVNKLFYELKQERNKQNPGYWSKFGG